MDLFQRFSTQLLNAICLLRKRCVKPKILNINASKQKINKSNKSIVCAKKPLCLGPSLNPGHGIVRGIVDTLHS